MARTGAVFVKSAFIAVFFASNVLEGLSYDQIYENNTVSVPKCCPNGEILTQNGCTKNDVYHFRPETNVYKHNATHVENKPLYPVEFLPYEYNLRCNGFRYALIPDTDNFALLQNGSLLLINSEQLFSLKEYCFETADVGEETENYLTTALICHTSGPPFPDHKFLIYLYVLDLIWPILTFAGYCYAKTNYKTPVIAFTLTVFCRRLLMLTSNAIGARGTCDCFRTAYYIVLLLSFIPLKMICVEVGCTLGKCSQKKKTKTKVIWALTVPTLVFLVLRVIYWDSILGNFLKTQFQLNSCWQEGSLIQAVATSVPLVVETVLVASLALSNYCKIKKLRTQGTEESVWKTLDSMTIACIILVILMAIFWASDIFVLLFLKSIGVHFLALEVMESFEGLFVLMFFSKPIINYLFTEVIRIMKNKNRYDSVSQTMCNA